MMIVGAREVLCNRVRSKLLAHSAPSPPFLPQTDWILKKSPPIMSVIFEHWWNSCVCSKSLGKVLRYLDPDRIRVGENMLIAYGTCAISYNKCRSCVSMMRVVLFPMINGIWEITFLVPQVCYDSVTASFLLSTKQRKRRQITWEPVFTIVFWDDEHCRHNNPSRVLGYISAKQE